MEAGPASITQRAAPKAAAWDMPRVKGEPRGFLRIDCIITPATARPAPAAMAARAWGIRICQTIIFHLSAEALLARVAIISGMGMLTAPTETEITSMIAKTAR